MITKQQALEALNCMWSVDSSDWYEHDAILKQYIEQKEEVASDGDYTDIENEAMKQQLVSKVEEYKLKYEAMVDKYCTLSERYADLADKLAEHKLTKVNR